MNKIQSVIEKIIRIFEVNNSGSSFNAIEKKAHKILGVIIILTLIQFFLFIMTLNLFSKIKTNFPSEPIGTQESTISEIQTPPETQRNPKEILKEAVPAFSLSFDTKSEMPVIGQGLKLVQTNPNELMSAVDLEYEESAALGDDGFGLKFSYYFAETLDVTEGSEDWLGAIFTIPTIEVSEEMNISFWLKGNLDDGYNSTITVAIVDDKDKNIKIPVHKISNLWTKKTLPLSQLKTYLDIENIKFITFFIGGKDLTTKKGSYSIDQIEIK